MRSYTQRAQSPYSKGLVELKELMWWNAKIRRCSKKSELKNYAKVRICPFGSLLHREDYVQNGIPLVNPSHIGEGKTAINPELTISKNKMKELSVFVMYEGDVVLGRRGEIGRCVVVTKKEDGYLCGRVEFS